MYYPLRGYSEITRAAQNRHISTKINCVPNLPLTILYAKQTLCKYKSKTCNESSDKNIDDSDDDEDEKHDNESGTNITAAAALAPAASPNGLPP